VHGESGDVAGVTRPPWDLAERLPPLKPLSTPAIRALLHPVGSLSGGLSPQAAGDRRAGTGKPRDPKYRSKPTGKPHSTPIWNDYAPWAAMPNSRSRQSGPASARNPAIQHPDILEGGHPRPKPIHLRYASIGTLFKAAAHSWRTCAELARVADRGRASVICNAVYGLGGIGKTRLAVEYAWQHREEYSALLLVVANTPRTFGAISRRWSAPGAGLAGAEGRDEEVRVAAALRWLQQNPGWFLIFDNVDTNEAAIEVERLLPSCTAAGPHTSRFSNWAPWWTGSISMSCRGCLRRYLLERTEKKRRRKAPTTGSGALWPTSSTILLGLAQAGAYIDKHGRRLHSISPNGIHPRGRAEVSMRSSCTTMRGASRSPMADVGQPARDRPAIADRLAWLAPEPVPEALLDSAVPDGADRRRSGRGPGGARSLFVE